jgi:type IV secretory pathway VirJ component
MEAKQPTPGFAEQLAAATPLTPAQGQAFIASLTADERTALAACKRASDVFSFWRVVVDRRADAQRKESLPAPPAEPTPLPVEAKKNK